MKIGHYCPTIWAGGGVASYIRRVSGEQRRLGHEVAFFDLARFRGETPANEDAPVFVEDAAELFRQAATQGLDILHTHLVLPGRARPCVPVIRTVHGHQPYCPSGSRFLQRQGRPCDRNYSALGCTWGHFVDHCGSVRPANLIADFRATRAEMATLRDIPTVTVSRFLKEQMVRAGYREELIHVLHLPAPDVKETLPPPQGGVPHFVFLGRITPPKGIAWLLRAIQEVRLPVHLDIAGEGHEEPDMRRLAARLGLEDRVTFHGWVSGERVHALLAQSRALIFPSVWHEPGGTVAFEAMVNGRAVLMSRVGGMPEVITEGVNGVLVEPNDVPGLARAIERLAQDWPLAHRLGEAGRRTAPEEFALRGHVEKLMGLYALCGAAAPAPAALVS